LRSRTNPNQGDTKQQLEDTERDTNGEAKKERTGKKLPDAIGFLPVYTGFGLGIVMGHGIVRRLLSR